MLITSLRVKCLHHLLRQVVPVVVVPGVVSGVVLRIVP